MKMRLKEPGRFCYYRYLRESDQIESGSNLLKIESNKDKPQPACCGLFFSKNDDCHSLLSCTVKSLRDLKKRKRITFTLHYGKPKSSR